MKALGLFDLLIGQDAYDEIVRQAKAASMEVREFLANEMRRVGSLDPATTRVYVWAGADEKPRLVYAPPLSAEDLASFRELEVLAAEHAMSMPIPMNLDAHYADQQKKVEAVQTLASDQCRWEEFAKAALIGLLSNSGNTTFENRGVRVSVATVACQKADEMMAVIAARRAQEPKA